MFVRQKPRRRVNKPTAPRRGVAPKAQPPVSENTAKIALQKVEEVLNMSVQQEVVEPAIEEPVIIVEEEPIVEAEPVVEEAPKKPSGNKNKKKNKTEKPAPEVNETVVSEEKAND